MNRKVFLVALVFLPVVFLSCISERTKNTFPVQAGIKPPESGTIQVKKVDREIEWGKLLSEAKKEGRVSIYSSLTGTTARAILQKFRERYGIDAEIVTGRGAEVSAKILSEHRAGLHLVDVYVGGVSTILSYLKPAAIMDKLEPAFMLPELIEEGQIKKTWYEEKLPWSDKDRTIFSVALFIAPPLGINTNLARPEEIASYNDLLNPRWKKKIVINDPTTSGTGRNTLAVIGWDLMSVDYLRALAAQEPIVLRDQRLQVEWVAKGKYPVVMPPLKDAFFEFMNAGAPIQFIVPKEGTLMGTGSGNVSLIKERPHPNAARIFINWLLSQEGTTVLCQTYGVQSSRLDVPTDYLLPIFMRQAGIKYPFTGTDEWEANLSPRAKVLIELFGPFLQ